MFHNCIFQICFWWGFWSIWSPMFSVNMITSYWFLKCPVYWFPLQQDIHLKLSDFEMKYILCCNSGKLPVKIYTEIHKFYVIACRILYTRTHLHAPSVSHNKHSPYLLAPTRWDIDWSVWPLQRRTSSGREASGPATAWCSHGVLNYARAEREEKMEQRAVSGTQPPGAKCPWKKTETLSETFRKYSTNAQWTWLKN